MKIKPILFSTPMIQAIIAGRKTQTRRIIKSKHESGMFEVSKTLDGIVTGITSINWDERPKNDFTNDIKPIAVAGDILWVRETWQDSQCFDYSMSGYQYKADKPASTHAEEYGIRWRPSIFMPKEAARIFLKVTNVRVERLQDISQLDAEQEGVKIDDEGMMCWDYLENRWLTHDGVPEKSFETLWQSINGIDSWDANPWVWVYEFEFTDKPKDFNHA